MRQLQYVAGTALATIAMVVSPAIAGAPKVLRLTSVTVSSIHQVRVTLATPTSRSKVYLAEVLVDKNLKLGKNCLVRRGDRVVADVALELGLDRAARVAAEPRVKDRRSYVFQATGPHASPRLSLNMLLVQRGIASVGKSRGTLHSAFLAAQRKAHKHHRGRWGCRRR